MKKIDKFQTYYTLDPQFKKYGLAKYGTHWCIFPSFVTKYINWVPDPGVSGIPGFSRNSFILLDACWSKTSYAQAMIDSFMAPGSLYVGWGDSPAQTRDIATIKYLFDRMLGANQFNKKSPPQRPSDYLSVQNELATWPDAQPYTLTYEGDPALALVPSIRRMGVDVAQQKLIIEGLFGEDYGEPRRSVTLGGQPLKLAKWSPDRLECKLPPDSVGDVIVAVDNRKSNPAPLTPICKDNGGTCCMQEEAQCSDWPEFDDVSKVTLSLHCVRYEGEPFDATVSVSRPSGCNYWRDSRTLHFGLDNPPPADSPDYNEIWVHIDGSFAGSGSFKTDSEDNIGVSASGFSDVVWNFDFDSLADPCTISVQTNLDRIKIPPGAEGKGKVSLQVSCPKLGSPGIECDVSPSSFRFSSSYCEASE